MLFLFCKLEILMQADPHLLLDISLNHLVGRQAGLHSWIQLYIEIYIVGAGTCANHGNIQVMVIFMYSFLNIPVSNIPWWKNTHAEFHILSSQHLTQGRELLSLYAGYMKSSVFD